MILPAGDAHEAGPLDAWTGAVDLVYRDPETDAIVVADYKTDVLASAEQRAERTAIYASQLKRYARAVGEALGLESEPRREIWWLADDSL